MQIRGELGQGHAKLFCRGLHTVHTLSRQVSGIGGAHNLNEFNKYRNEINVVNVEKHPTLNGVQRISYQIRALDRAAQPTAQWKTRVYDKTVYDPAVISDEKMLQWGREAAAEAQAANRLTHEWTGYANNGIEFRGYLDETGAVVSFFPDF